MDIVPLFTACILVADADMKAGMSISRLMTWSCWILFSTVVTATHVDTNTVNVCSLPKKTGPCNVFTVRYFYNTTLCQCEQFIWGGCESNGNNFDQLDVCQATCESTMPSNYICSQPRHSGAGTPYRLRWWFNATSCKCEGFIFGDGLGNDNNFETEDNCKSVCGCYSCDVCQLPISQGDGGSTCQAQLISFGFNKTSCQCEGFLYSGCGGNDNRFSSMNECNDSCGNMPCVSKLCDLPADPGHCAFNMTRYFYNTNTCQCEEFTWGGCGGNGNNYLTKEFCMDSCNGHQTCDNDQRQCYLPESGGSCQAHTTRYHYDPLQCKCKKFLYNGCQGNDNNFLSKLQCMTTCENAVCPICNLPKVPGPCQGSYQRYFYNITSCQCEPFIYGGCGGNENQFQSPEDCQAICGSVQCPVCNQPASRGRCNANLTRWYYDAAECKCKAFVYGGCRGNMNRFHTKSDCEGSCGTFPCPVCTLPQKSGPCEASTRRWHYDSAKNKCVKFSWGGCEPNGNNFKSRRSCNKVCRNFVCSLPAQVGPCEASFLRYYFDNSTATCKPFSWGGCKSNGNNFESLESCRDRCLR